MRTRTCLILSLCLLAGAGCGEKQKSTPELLNDLKGGKEGDRVKAVRTLPQGNGDAAQVVPALIAALKDKQPDVRWSAAIKLGTFGERAKEAIPALQAAQSDRDVRIREAASKRSGASIRPGSRSLQGEKDSILKAIADRDLSRRNAALTANCSATWHGGIRTRPQR